MKDPLLSNKIAAAVLAALILIFGLPQLTGLLFGGGHGGAHGDELHLAYCCVDLETSGATAPVEEAPADLGTLLASASAAGGQRRAALCASCHTFDEGGANGNGPNLWNIVNREVGSVAGFNYSAALTDFGGVWTYERLNEYIKDSQSYVPGTGMAQRMGRDDQRADILAYLGSLSASPVAFPAPVEVEAPAEDVEHAASEALEHAGDAAAEVVENAADAGDAAIEAASDAAAEMTDAAGDAVNEALESAEDVIENVEEAAQPEEN